MSDIREIKSHIKGVNDTAKITRAMYMIASGKMRRAKIELDNTRPYFDALRTEIGRVFKSDIASDSPYLWTCDDMGQFRGYSGYTIDEQEININPDAPYGYLVITSDKGMAGYYNHGILKMMESRIAEHESKIYMIGALGEKHCRANNIPMEDDFAYTADDPTFRRARAIAGRLIDDYLKGKISRVIIIYTDLKNGVYQQALDCKLLPLRLDEEGDLETDKTGANGYGDGGLSPEHQGAKGDTAESFEFYPSVEKVLDNMVSNYVAGYIYSALVDSYCCEQCARMNAMDEANRNADEILNDLNLKYNHARQGRITQEITEVSSGARALKRKKMRGQAK